MPVICSADLITGERKWDAYVALKGATFVDGEDENDVLAGFKCFFENGAVLGLSCPDRLFQLAGGN